jgi:hypothetical protein
MRLIILCEDRYGADILPKFLAPYLIGFQHVEAISFKGCGNVVNEMADEATYWLTQDSANVVLGLIDLKACPLKPPRAVRDSDNPTIATRDWVAHYFTNDIAESLRPRFLMCPTVMELETWLLADLANLPVRGIQRLDRPHAPESIKDPTADLKRHIEQASDRKKTYTKAESVKYFVSEGLAERVYADNCPSFVWMIDRLREVQGLKPKPDPQPTWSWGADPCDTVVDEFNRMLEVAQTDADLEACLSLEREHPDCF